VFIFTGSVQNPDSSILYKLQLSYGVIGKASKEFNAIIHPAGLVIALT